MSAATASTISAFPTGSRNYSLKQRVSKAAQVVRKLSTTPLVSVQDVSVAPVKTQTHDTPPSYTTSPESQTALRSASSTKLGSNKSSPAAAAAAAVLQKVKNVSSPRIDRSPLLSNGSSPRRRSSSKTNSAHFKQAIMSSDLPPPPSSNTALHGGLSIQGLDGYLEQGPTNYQPSSYLPNTSLGPAFEIPALDGLGLGNFGEEDLVMTTSQDNPTKGQPTVTARPLSNSHELALQNRSTGQRLIEEGRTAGVRPTRQNRTSSSSIHTLEIKLSRPRNEGIAAISTKSVPSVLPGLHKKQSHHDLRAKAPEFRRMESEPNLAASPRMTTVSTVEKRRSIAGDMRQARTQASRASLRNSLYKPLPRQPISSPAPAQHALPPSGYCIRPSVTVATQTPSWWHSDSASTSSGDRKDRSETQGTVSHTFGAWSNTTPQAYTAFPTSSLTTPNTYTETYPSPSIYSVVDTLDVRTPPPPRHQSGTSSLGRNDWNRIVNGDPITRSQASSRRSSSASSSPPMSSSGMGIVSLAKISPASTSTPLVQAELIASPKLSGAESTSPFLSTTPKSPDEPRSTEFATSPPWTSTTPSASLRTKRAMSMQTGGTSRRSSSYDFGKRESFSGTSLSWSDSSRPYVRPRPVSVFNPAYKPSVPFQPTKKLAPIEISGSDAGSRLGDGSSRSAPASRPVSTHSDSSRRESNFGLGVGVENEQAEEDESPIDFRTPFLAPSPPSKNETVEIHEPSEPSPEHSPKSSGIPIFNSPNIIPATPVPSFPSPSDEEPNPADKILSPIPRHAATLSIDPIAANRRRSLSITPPPRSPLRRASLAPSPEPVVGEGTSQPRRKSLGPPVNPPSPARRSSRDSGRGSSPAPSLTK